MPETSEQTAGQTTAEKPATPAWDGEFDAERAARLVQNLRDEIATLKGDLKTARSSLQEREDAEKTEAQRLQERAEAAERALAEKEKTLLRQSVAKAHNLDDDLLDFLSGDTEEALTAQAKALSERIRPAGQEVPGKPKPALTPGSGDGDTAPAFDPKAIASAVRDL